MIRFRITDPTVLIDWHLPEELLNQELQGTQEAEYIRFEWCGYDGYGLLLEDVELLS